ncbi:MAG TPA: beta-ketoacyl synthase N-terminal-like domain-containing protein [Thermoanaerobaculia bacterium]|nr:beta-ketoacyl synthase N-terminal-like domain-containing protein [Thermoanaerobaculia bacterium]
MTQSRARVGIFGWGIVAPRSPDVSSFERNLETASTWLEPFDGFGPDNFLVGRPEFRLESYREWLSARFPPSRLNQIQTKMGMPTQYAMGAFIQALGQNPGIEQELRSLGTAAHVYVGTGVGDLPTIYDASLRLDRAQARWDRFWAEPAHNCALRRFLGSPDALPGPPRAAAEQAALLGSPGSATSAVAALAATGELGAAGERGTTAELRAAAALDAMAELEACGSSPPPHPATVAAADYETRADAERAWNRFWAVRSPELAEYLAELRRIEGADVVGEVGAAKKSLLRQKRAANARLQEKWGAPTPPWDDRLLANVIWNIHNTPASNISMLGGITGLTFAPVGACATFGITLKLAMDAVRRGEAKAVVIGAADPPPHPLLVGAFYNGRVISADGEVSRPLTGMRGTHVSGGAAIWIVGDWEHMTARGFRPLGLEPVAVGVSADAEHIITPSEEGPLTAIGAALEEAGVDPGEVSTWDLHATATPGDWQEVENLRRVLPESVLVTARKGIFGHGMGASGGWELTAQYLGLARGRIFPTPLAPDELNSEIAKIHTRFVFDHGCPAPAGVVGKLSMGVGGVNACVLSRVPSDGLPAPIIDQ